MGLDGRIGAKFLHAGPGYGGSCFPKDTLALTQIGQKYKTPQTIVETVVKVNKDRQAEMADRVHERLGAWVTLPDADLRKELCNLGEEHLGIQLAKARQLFAQVLDARGGGLRIQTIHSFAQSLLAAFPAEAGLPVGFRPVEGREESQLREDALASLVA